jgi:hypothetical protein
MNVRHCPGRPPIERGGVSGGTSDPGGAIDIKPSRRIRLKILVHFADVYAEFRTKVLRRFAIG